MTGIEYLNSEDCPNIKAGMGLNQIQLYVIAGILEAYHEKQLTIHSVVKSFTAEKVGDMLANKFTTIEEAIHYFDTIE